MNMDNFSDKLPRRKQRGISGNYLTGYAASGGVLDPNENKMAKNCLIQVR